MVVTIYFFEEKNPIKTSLNNQKHSRNTGGDNEAQMIHHDHNKTQMGSHGLNYTGSWK